MGFSGTNSESAITDSPFYLHFTVLFLFTDLALNEFHMRSLNEIKDADNFEMKKKLNISIYHYVTLLLKIKFCTKKMERSKKYL